MKFGDTPNDTNLNERAVRLTGEMHEVMQKHGRGTSMNLDYISPAVYKAVFNKRINNGGIVLNIGAGFSLTDTRLNALNRTLDDVCKANGATLVPVDTNPVNAISYQLSKKHFPDKVNQDTYPLIADATNLPFASNSISCVASSNVVNCPDPSRIRSIRDMVLPILKEVYRVLKPGGSIVLSSFGYYPEEIVDGVTVYNDDITENDFYTLKQLSADLANIGFVDQNEIEIDEDRNVTAQRLWPGYVGLSKVKEYGGITAYKPNV